MGGRRRVSVIVHAAEERRILKNDSGHRLVEGGFNSFFVSFAVFALYFAEFEIHVGGVALQHVAVDGIDRAVDQKALPAGHAVAHGRRFENRGTPVVNGGVGDFQSGQPAHAALILEHRLQGSLRDFGLIRRIAGREFAAGSDGVRSSRDEVIVKTASHEADEIRVVALGKLVKSFGDFVFRNTFRQIQFLDPQILRNSGVKVLYAFYSDGIEHLRQVSAAVRHKSKVRHNYFSSFKKASYCSAFMRVLRSSTTMSFKVQIQPSPYGSVLMTSGEESRDSLTSSTVPVMGE